ncbi:MAG: HTH domain-containing protein [Myxococcales bacterium]|nr:HTH domain-containing protein [Myxococcales bacterium]
MSSVSISQAKERMLWQLKEAGPSTVAELAESLEITTVAVRQHLNALRADGQVTVERVRGVVGRPAGRWRVVVDPPPSSPFPDAHRELAVELLEGVSDVFGEEGLRALIARRADQQRREYSSRLTSASLEERVARLTEIRSHEGYVANWEACADGTFLLVEGHCPICAAARRCRGLCSAELETFREVLGAEVEREEYLLSEGGRRCVYRISPAAEQKTGED